MAGIFSGIGSLFGYSASTTAIATSTIPQLALIPIPTLIAPRPYSPYSPYNTYQNNPYGTQIPAPAQPVCSIDYFSYTTIAPLVEVTRTHDVTKVVNTTIFVPSVKTTTVIDVETIIVRQGGTPKVVVAQTTQCNDGYPAWQTALAPTYQQLSPQQDPQPAYPAFQAERQDDAPANVPYYQVPSKKAQPSAAGTRIWQQDGHQVTSAPLRPY